MKIQLTLIVDLGDNWIDPDDAEERDWFFKDVVGEAKQLYIHSNEAGDELGEIIEIVEVKEIKPKNNDK